MDPLWLVTVSGCEAVKCDRDQIERDPFSASTMNHRTARYCLLRLKNGQSALHPHRMGQVGGSAFQLHGDSSNCHEPGTSPSESSHSAMV